MKIKKAKISIVAGYNMERFKELFFKGGKQAKQKIARVFTQLQPETADLRVQNSKTGSAINAQFCGLRELFFSLRHACIYVFWYQNVP